MVVKQPDPLQAPKLSDIRRARTLTFFVFFIGIAIAWFAQNYIRTNQLHYAKLKFERETVEIENHLTTRLDSYISALYSAQGLFAASKSVERDEWEAFIRGQHLLDRYPGIQAFRFIERVKAEDKTKFIESVRSDTSLEPTGYPEYNIYPEGERDEYFVTKYIEPMARNEKMLGFDLGTQHVRKEALVLARDTGLPQITENVAMVTDTSIQGFLIVLPIYKNHTSHETLEERRENLTGFVDGVFNTKNFFSALFNDIAFPPGMEIQIFDGDQMREVDIIYESNRDRFSRLASHRQSPIQLISIKAAGHVWLLRLIAESDFALSPIEKRMPLLVFAGGVISSFFLFLIFLISGSTKNQAVILASKMTHALQEKEKYLEAVMAGEPDCVQVVGREGLITQINQSGLQMLEAAQDIQVIGKSMNDILHPEDVALYQRHHESICRGARVDALQFRMISLKGKMKWVESNSAPLRNESGVVIGALSVVRDITDRKRTERVLKAQFSATRILSESTSVEEAFPKIIHEICDALNWHLGMVWEYDLKIDALKVFQYWQRPLLNFTLFENASRIITLKPGTDLPGRIFQSQRTDWVEDVVKDPNFQRAPYAAKVGLRGAFAFPVIVDGEAAYVMEFFSIEVRPREDPLLRMMTVISGQIGQFVSRRRAESERLLIDARLRHVTESFPGVIYQFHQTKGGELSFPFVSSSVKELLGATAEEIEAKVEAAFSMILSEDLPKVYDTIRVSAVTLKPWDFEFRVNAPDSKVKWLRGSAVPLRQSDGGTLWNGVLTDITEKKGIEEKIIQSNEELKSTQIQLGQAAKMETVGRLAAGIAHEVKNPLAIILMGLDFLMRKNAAGNDETKMILQDMTLALKRADGVIRGLLDFSTASKLNEEMQDLNFLIEGSLIFVKHELMKAHVYVQKELTPGLPLLKLDKPKLEQVFINIFMNAIQAMAEGGTLTIRTKLKKFTPQDTPLQIKPDFFKTGDQGLIAEIDDNGIGIPEDKIHKIFEPFFTTKPTGQGTGLGLCVSKRIVELHNGLLDVENKPEGGVRCTLYFKTA